MTKDFGGEISFQCDTALGVKGSDSFFRILPDHTEPVIVIQRPGKRRISSNN
jgi:hypothetical protein